jgi:hypothetical protein
MNGAVTIPEITDQYCAGIFEARGQVSIFASSGGRRRPQIEVMFRDRQLAEFFQEHFGRGGEITTETPRYRQDVRNHVYRVRGGGADQIIRRVLPYLVGPAADSCRSSLERSNRAA